MKTGIELIAIERQEQLTKHGRTIKYDTNFNVHYQLSQAASVLVYNDPEELDASIAEADDERYDFSHVCPPMWSEAIFNRIMNKPYMDRLIIAGTLIAAEIDRLQNEETENQ